MKTRTRIFFLSLDIISMLFAMVAAIWFRFETFSNSHVHYACILLLFSIPSSVFVFWVAGLYNRTLLFTSISDLIAVFYAVTVAWMLKMSFIYFHKEMFFSRVILILDWVLNLMLIGGSRIAPRIILDLLEITFFRGFSVIKPGHRGKRALLYGAGRAGESLIREIRRNKNLHYHILGFIDDDPLKTGQIIHGTKILGTRQILSGVLTKKRIDEIIIAIPSASGSVLREIVKLCSASKVRFKTIPGLQDMLDGKLVGLQLRDIAIEDLLRRPTTEANCSETNTYITEQVVLIVGAGGSIGAEISAQILQFKPGKLLLMGHGENSIFSVHQNLLRHPEAKSVEIIPIIADIGDRGKLVHLFSRYRPNIVFHSAAHKHISLMEQNPEEAVKNNILGAQKLAMVAHEFETDQVIMVSTYKAVNPTSIMGVTKRIAEMIIKVKGFSKRSQTRFMVARLGNLLDDRGSVISIFKKQIEQGGPVRIPHPNMVRYFMTIPEASRLVIQAGAFSNGGEIFLLDMGEPVKVVDLATNLIRLAGLEIEKDISIEFSGACPNEKLFEALLTAEEGVTSTPNKKIFIAKSEEVNEDWLRSHIQQLNLSIKERNRSKILEALQAIVPSFQPNEENVLNDQELF